MTLETITTERLLLRAWMPDDVDAFIATYSREEVYRWLGSVPTAMTDPDEARGRIERWAGVADDVKGLWAVETPGIPGLAPQPCGTVLLVTLPRSDGEESSAYEIGWHLNPAAWGHGVATEAGRAMIERARTAGLSEVHAVVYPDNARSLAVCDRLGMMRLGVTDAWYGVELVDHVLAL